MSWVAKPGSALSIAFTVARSSSTIAVSMTFIKLQMCEAKRDELMLASSKCRLSVFLATPLRAANKKCEDCYECDGQQNKSEFHGVVERPKALTISLRLDN